MLSLPKVNTGGWGASRREIESMGPSLLRMRYYTFEEMDLYIR